ncbi:MAG: DUF1684 domain-containing protein [Betaproteobacteria bacterium]|nr:DUF1684 domain-containing protein [Betaproteobacteria bacterium]
MPTPALARRLAPIALAGIAFCAAAAAPDPAVVDELAKWRARADASLTRERGWLSIVSRDELTPGTYRIGSAPDSQIVLPKGLAPAHLGVVVVSDGKARLELAKGQKMRTVTKEPDDSEEFTARDLVTGASRLEWVTAGRLSLQFVKREDGRIVVRAADRDSPRRRNFAGRVWFEPKAEFRVPAKFVPTSQGATIPIANVRGEISYEKVAGTLEFAVNGQKMSLDALDDEGNLFIIFRDGTSNSTTYPPGRFLFIEKPKDGTWIVDFNRAYNPPCAFSAFTTCPLPPPQNWLKGDMAAGEKYAGRKS